MNLAADANSWQVNRFSYIDKEGGSQAVMLRINTNLIDRDTLEQVLLLPPAQALDLAAELITQASLCEGSDV